MRRLACQPVVIGDLLISAILMAGWGCLPFPGNTPLSFPVADGLRAEYVVFGALHPSGLAFAPDGRVFYTEKNTGQIRVIAADNRFIAEPFAAVPVNYADDRGLLGIALHPEFAQNNRVYVFYTRSDTGQTTGDLQAVIDNRVVYFEADGNVAAGGEIFVASLPADAGTARVSGRIAFTPDDKLLIAIGDLTDPGSALNNGVLVGKILRYNADGSIPDDNPIAGSPVYARGLRDVRGLCIDPANGMPFALDRNGSGNHEVNRILSGKNYGWPAVTGQARLLAGAEYAASNADYVDPAFDTGPGSRVVSGASFNPSGRYGPGPRLNFFYGEANGRRVLSGELSRARDSLVSVKAFATGFPGAITDVAFSPAGTLYVACHNAIFRITPDR